MLCIVAMRGVDVFLFGIVAGVDWHSVLYSIGNNTYIYIYIYIYISIVKRSHTVLYNMSVSCAVLCTIAYSVGKLP